MLGIDLSCLIFLYYSILQNVFPFLGLLIFPIKFQCFLGLILDLLVLAIYFQVSAGAEFVGGQFICICSDIQIFQSATYVSGAVLIFSALTVSTHHIVFILALLLLYISLTMILCVIYETLFMMQIRILGLQNRVLSYGIAGAVIFRLSIILLGTATLQVGC